MRRFSLLCVLAVTLCAVAMANIIPSSITSTGSGPYTWTYDLQLSSDQNVNSGLAQRAIAFRMSTLVLLAS